MVMAVPSGRRWTRRRHGRQPRALVAVCRQRRDGALVQHTVRLRSGSVESGVQAIALAVGRCVQLDRARALAQLAAAPAKAERSRIFCWSWRQQQSDGEREGGDEEGLVVWLQDTRRVVGLSDARVAHVRVDSD